jgi:hypothetical protein
MLGVILKQSSNSTECKPDRPEKETLVVAGNSFIPARERELSGIELRARARMASRAAGRERSGAHSVHPRMRGEHRRFFGSLFTAGGSSPHARGTRWARRRHIANLRFIPACAGNTARTARAAIAAAVHPRMRGEHLMEPTLAAARGQAAFLPPIRAHAREARAAGRQGTQALQEMLGVRPMRCRAVRITTKS